jgi:hypothetical protein
MKKLTTLILLLLSPLVMAQEKGVSDIYLKCEPISDTWGSSWVVESYVFLIAATNKWGSVFLLEDTAATYADSALPSLDDLSPKMPESNTVHRELEYFSLSEGAEIWWNIDRTNGTSKKLFLGDDGLENLSNCESLTRQEVEQLFSEHSQKLSAEKQRITEGRQF